MYKAFDKNNDCEISFSYEKDAEQAKIDGWIDQYIAYECIIPEPDPKEETRDHLYSKLSKLDAELNRPTQDILEAMIHNNKPDPLDIEKLEKGLIEKRKFRLELEYLR